MKGHLLNNPLDILSPVNGVITKVNESVKTSPGLPVKRPIYGNLPALGWQKLTHAFLKT